MKGGAGAVWNQDKSVVLSSICTKIVIALALLLAVALPFVSKGGFFEGRELIQSSLVTLVLPVYYAFCVPALVALFALDRLLAAIKRGDVFTLANVRLLRIISWACFAAAIILAISVVVSIVFGFIAVLAAFFGMILRVVKNLFAAAVELKTENDLTV
jgi:hypothetical protein